MKKMALGYLKATSPEDRLYVVFLVCKTVPPLPLNVHLPFLLLVD